MPRLLTTSTHHVHLDPQQVLKLKPQSGMVEQTAFRLEVNHQVNVALFIGFPTDDGTEDMHDLDC